MDVSLSTKLIRAELQIRLMNRMLTEHQENTDVFNRPSTKNEPRIGSADPNEDPEVAFANLEQALEVLNLRVQSLVTKPPTINSRELNGTGYTQSN